MIKPSARRNVYDRDKWQCWYCSKKLNPSITANDENSPCLDHIIPKAMEGDNRQSNLRTSCKYCNAAKADLDLEEYRWKLTLKKSATAKNYQLFNNILNDLESMCESEYEIEVSTEINKIREMRDTFQFNLHRFFGEGQQ